MRRGYSQDIRAEAITKRYQGREWKEIRSLIGEKFGVRPSIRQMQKWFEDYQGTTTDPTGVRYVARLVEDSANLVRPLVQAKMMSEVFPLWYYLQQDNPDLPNLSVFNAGWVAMWCFFESQIGRENLDRTYSVYREVRDKIPQQPVPWPPPSWMRQPQTGNGQEQGNAEQTQQRPPNIEYHSIDELPDSLKERR